MGASALQREARRRLVELSHRRHRAGCTTSVWCDLSTVRHCMHSIASALFYVSFCARTSGAKAAFDVALTATVLIVLQCVQQTAYQKID